MFLPVIPWQRGKPGLPAVTLHHGYRGQPFFL